jgi:hypothetical protein
MASGEAEVSVQPEIDSSADGAIRVIVADSEPIFRVGVRKIVAIEWGATTPTSCSTSPL